MSIKNLRLIMVSMMISFSLFAKKGDAWIAVKNDYSNKEKVVAGVRGWGCIGLKDGYTLLCSKPQEIPYGQTVRFPLKKIGYGSIFNKDKAQIFVKVFGEAGIYLNRSSIKNNQTLVFRGTQGAIGDASNAWQENDFYYFDFQLDVGPLTIKNPLPGPS